MPLDDRLWASLYALSNSLGAYQGVHGVLPWDERGPEYALLLLPESDRPNVELRAFVRDVNTGRAKSLRFDYLNEDGVLINPYEPEEVLVADTLPLQTKHLHYFTSHGRVCRTEVSSTELQGLDTVTGIRHDVLIGIIGKPQDEEIPLGVEVLLEQLAEEERR